MKRRLSPGDVVWNLRTKSLYRIFDRLDAAFVSAAPLGTRSCEAVSVNDLEPISKSIQRQWRIEAAFGLEDGRQILVVDGPRLKNGEKVWVQECRDV